jgi:phosphoglycolate phosphatase-like HAD superfamily hydrolase
VRSSVLTNYDAIYFDCDGVLLNSNEVKTRAFQTVARPFGEKEADELVAYHVANGGVSRYRKLDHFLNVICEEKSEPDSLAKLLDHYASEVADGLLECEVAVGLSQLREKTAGSRWFVVSGGDQAELREIFKVRELTNHFDGGIFGSPETKVEILSRLVEVHPKPTLGVFIGDSQYDYDVATKFGLDFIFVEQWTEFKEWKQLQKVAGFLSINNLGELL